MTLDALILLLVFQIKHLLADYYLQFPYMYENKGKPTGWVEPLLDHAGVHAIFTAIIIGVYFDIYDVSNTLDHNILFFSIIVFDFVTHFITDRWKATRGRTPNESKFWTALGIDQMVHHTVGILIVFGIHLYI